MSKIKNWLSGAGPWVPHRLDMITSTAWLSRSNPLTRILDRLEEEHMRHAGTMNGSLCVSYQQFIDRGVSRRTIGRALKLGEDLGLLEVIRPTGKIGGTLRSPNMYRLTYLPANGQAPTDNWKLVTPAQIQAALKIYYQ